MAASKKLKVEIVGDAEKARAALKKLDGSLEHTESVTTKMSSSIKTKLAGAGLAALIFGSLNDATESIKVAKQTEAVIKSTGGVANVTADQVGDLASAISRKTGVDDEAIQSGENLLLTFKNIRNEQGEGNDIFNQSVHIMQDMASAMGQDATTSALTLGKALNDPETGYSRLTRVGVTFTEQQKEQIRTLSESGDVMGAQKILLEELASEFEGSAEAQASSMDKIRTEVGNASEALGTALMPALDVASDAVGVLTGAFEGLPQPIQAAAPIVGAAAIAWGRWGDSLKGLASNGAWGRLRAGMSGAAGEATGFAGKFGKMMRVVKSSPAIWVGAAAAVGLIVMKWRDAEESAKRVANNATLLQEAIRGTGVTMEDAFNEKVLNTLYGYSDAFDLGESGMDAFQIAVRRSGVSVEELSSGLTGSQSEFDGLSAKIANSNSWQVGTSATQSLKEMRQALKDAEVNSKDAAGAAKVLGLSEEGLAESTDDAADSADAQAESLRNNMAAAAKIADDTLKGLISSLKDYSGQTTSVLESDIQVQAGLDALTSSLKENGNRWDINSGKGRENYQAMIQVKDAIYDNVEALIEQGKPLGEVRAKWDEQVESLKSTMRQSKLTEDQIDLLIVQMGLTPSDISTVFHTNAGPALEGVKQLAGAVSSIPRDVWIGFHVLGDAVAAAAAGARGHAKGGRLNPGWNLVGEHGPELTDGKTVIGAGRTQAKLDAMPPATTGGDGTVTVINQVTVKVAGSVMADHDLADIITDELTRRQRRSAAPLLPGISG